MLTRPSVRERALRAVQEHARAVVLGRVLRVTGTLIEARVPGAMIGDLLDIDLAAKHLMAEVVGFRDEIALAVPFADVRGLGPGAHVRRRDGAAEITVSTGLFGRAIDPFGHPVDGGPPLPPGTPVRVDNDAPATRDRARVSKRFDTGVRIVDTLLTCGRGQRVGIFAGAGVGKTVLIRQIARQSSADVVVLGLIGERGCEVSDFLAADLGKKTVTVVATSDRSPMERARGARAATAIAEHFRTQGANVLLIIDSLTRYAMALREIGLAIGEPPATKGYPPSVFAALPRLLERAAPLTAGGSITGFYSVLVEGDDLADPVADSARSLLDAHLVLSRDLAGRGHFPAVDVLASASRVANQVTGPAERTIAQDTRSLLATRREAEELRSLGAYVAGANPAYDDALAMGARLDAWSRQGVDDRSDPAAGQKALGEILAARRVKK